MDVKIQPKVKKESAAKVIELKYDGDKRVLTCLNSDNKLEFFKINIDSEESLLKKMIRVEKRKGLKRNRQ